MKKFLVEIVCGYMLKVVKSGTNIIKYENEFNSIKHGNYYEFLGHIKAPLPQIVVYSTSEIKEIDFVSLNLCGPALVKFFEMCRSEYGKIYDNDISDDTFGKLVLFELCIKMHAKNHNIPTAGKIDSKKIDMPYIINELCKIKNISTDENQYLLKGNAFLNRVKHNESIRNKSIRNKSKYYNWKVGNENFLKAYETLKTHDLILAADNF